MPKLSSRHALTAQEIEFCKAFSAGGESRLDLHYTRAFLILRPGNRDEGIERGYVEPTIPLDGLTVAQRFEALNRLPLVEVAEIKARARAKLRDPLIKKFLKELEQSPTMVAEQALFEQALLGDEKDARGASTKILELDQRANRRDDIYFLADVLDQAGFEVVVDLPTEVRKDVICPACGHAQHVVFPVEAAGKFVAPLLEEGEVQPAADG